MDEPCVQWILLMGYMHAMHLPSLDLNLLVVLDALLTTRNVTAAGRRLGLSQSATSHALARLREHLGDPLLVRGPKGSMVPTPRAESLFPPLRAALVSLEDALRAESGFDPSRSTRRFMLATSDYVELTLLPPLLARLRASAPSITLQTSLLREESAPGLSTGEIDMALGPVSAALGSARTGFHRASLFDERFVCVIRRNHPAARKKLTLERYLGLDHVLVSPGGKPGSIVDDVLARIGKERRVVVTVPHFLVVPHLLSATDLIVTLAERVARTFAPLFDLVIKPPPLDVPGFSVSLLWHERVHGDPAARWLRGLVADVAKEI